MLMMKEFVDITVTAGGIKPPCATLTRNRILFMRRNVPIPGLSVFVLYFILFTIPKNTMTYLVKKQGEHLKWFWKGILWHFNSKIKFN